MLQNLNRPQVKLIILLLENTHLHTHTQMYVHIMFNENALILLPLFVAVHYAGIVIGITIQMYFFH